MTTEIQLTTKEELYGTENKGYAVVSCDNSQMITDKDISSVSKKPVIGRCPVWGPILLGTGGECLFEVCAKNSRSLSVAVPEKAKLVGARV
jgi:hypothetical protein